MGQLSFSTICLGEESKCGKKVNVVRNSCGTNKAKLKDKNLPPNSH